MEFTIKPAKKKKHGKGVQSAKAVCELVHCPRVPTHCTHLECHQQIADAVQSLENEKLATLTPAQKARFDYLASAPNVVLSPHIGGWTHQSYQRINEVLVAKIEKVVTSD